MTAIVDQLINITVSLSASTVTAPNFGSFLCMATHTLGGSAKVMGPYTTLAGAVSAGFTSMAYPLVYNSLSKFFGQGTSVTAWVGKRTTSVTQLDKFTPLTTHQGDVININVGAVMGVGGTLASYTVPSSASLATVCTGLAAALNTAFGSGTPFSGSSGTFVQFTGPTPGVLTEFQVQTPTLCGFLENTAADSALATDLANVWNVNQSWYGLGLDSNSANEIESAAAWVETNKRIFAPHSADTEIFDSGSTTDVASALKTSAYTRTGLLAVQNSNLSFAGAALMGKQFGAVPGSDTWAYKTLAGVNADNPLPVGWDTNALAKYATVYEAIGVTGGSTQNATLGGTCAAGNYFDTVRFIDWQVADMKTALLARLLSSAKVPRDKDGYALIETDIRNSMARGVTNGGLVAGTVQVNMPDPANASQSDLTTRNLSGITVTGKLATPVQSINPLTITLTE